MQAGGKACCRRGGRRTGGAQKTGISAHFSAGCIEEYKKKFTNSAVYYELPLAEIGTKEELGRAIGAEMRSIIAITEKGFAKKLKELADDNIENRTKVGEG